MVTTKLNLSMTEPQVRQIYAKQGDTGRVLDISLDQTPEDGTLRILRPDGVEVTSEAVTGGEVESGGTFESLTEADVTELTVGIEPVQDFNGYDHPWVGGAGDNKYPNCAIGGTINGATVAHNASTETYSFSGTTTAYTQWISTETFTLPSGTYYFKTFYSSTVNGLNAQLRSTDGTTTYILGDGRFTLSGDTKVKARFTAQANFNVQGVTARIMLVSGSTAPTTWQPYSNICPITGHDEVRVTRTGKNLGKLSSNNEGSHQRATVVYTNSGVTITATNTYGRYGWIMPVIKGKTYTFSCKGIADANADYKTVFFGNEDGTYSSSASGYLAQQTIGTSETSISFTFTAVTNILFVGVYVTSGVSSGSVALSNVLLELGSTATAYEPYQGSTYTTSLGQTVYGGTLDMVSGVLTVDRAMVSLLGSDLGIGSWTTKELNMWRLSLNNPYGTLASSYPGGISNKYVLRNSYTGVNNNNGSLGLNQVNGSQVLIRDDSLTTAQEVIDAFNSTPLTFVYPLAEPQTYQLTPQQIKTLVGTNNVWASSGDIVNIKFTYGGLLSELPSDATEIVGKCYCDVEQNGVSSMPFTLNVKKNERQ